MPFCSACGAQVEQATFCPRCGAPQGAAPAAAVSSSPSGTAGMAENTAGALCYALGWITGLIFFLIDKRPYVRFHAAQSIVVFGGLHILNLALGLFAGASLLTGGFHLFGSGFLLLHLIHLIGLVLWILLMVKAYQGERFKVPIAWEVAEGLLGKQPL